MAPPVKRCCPILLSTLLFGCRPGNKIADGGGAGDGENHDQEGSNGDDYTYSDGYAAPPLCDQSTLTFSPPDGAVDVPTTFDVVASLRMKIEWDDASPEVYLSTRPVDGLPGEGDDYTDPSIEEEVAGGDKILTYTWSPVVLPGGTDYDAGVLCLGRSSDDWFTVSWTLRTAAEPPDTGATDTGAPE